MTSQPDRLNRRHLLLGSVMLASGVHASDELTGGDPLGSMQWPTLRKQYLGQAPMRFAPEVVVRGPTFADDAMNVPLQVDARALAGTGGGVDRIQVVVDRNPVREVLVFEPLRALPMLAFRFRMEQASPVRALVRTRDGRWHVGGTWVQAAGGGCTVPGVTRADGSWSRTLGQVQARVFRNVLEGGTRLRLRVELLEDEKLQAKFGRDLDELELLVKGALQCVKDTDIHENIQPVDLNHVLECLVEPYVAPNGNGRVTLDGAAVAAYPGKPLALRRCIGNLIDNAIKYGERARLRIIDGAEGFVLQVDDQGPGVPQQQLEQVFEPHFRLAGQQQGYGLGLGIARNIAHSHGGEVSLLNLREGGLRVTLYLPRGMD